MASPFGPMVLIVDPASGRGRSAASYEEVRAALYRSLDLEHRVVLTAGPGDATRAAREALKGGPNVPSWPSGRRGRSTRS